MSVIQILVVVKLGVTVNVSFEPHRNTHFVVQQITLIDTPGFQGLCQSNIYYGRTSFTAGVHIGFVETLYTAYEGGGSLEVDVEVMRGLVSGRSSIVYLSPSHRNQT